MYKPVGMAKNGLKPTSMYKPIRMAKNGSKPTFLKPKENDEGRIKTLH